MDKFYYSKRMILINWILLGCTLLWLGVLLWAGFWLVWPSKGHIVEVRFGWWVPPFMVLLAILAIFQFWNIQKKKHLLVELHDLGLRVDGQKLRWDEVSQVEFKMKSGILDIILLQSAKGLTLEIPAGMEDIQYIQGFVAGHTENATRVGWVKPTTELKEITRVFIGVLQSWKERKLSYTQRFDLLKQFGYGKIMADSLLGEAEWREPCQTAARDFLAKMHESLGQAADSTQISEYLKQQGFGPLAIALLMAENDPTGVQIQTVSEDIKPSTEVSDSCL